MFGKMRGIVLDRLSALGTGVSGVSGRIDGTLMARCQVGHRSSREVEIVLDGELRRRC